MNEKEIDVFARKLWDFNKLNFPLEKTDCIFIFGSEDFRVAERAAKIWLKGLAPYIVITGGIGRFTPKIWNSEAEMLAKTCLKFNVPKNKILIENKSSNAEENIRFGFALLAKSGIYPETVITVHQPFMAYRAYLTMKKIWPRIKIIPTTPEIEYLNYPNRTIPKDEIINRCVGEVQRLQIYPKKGFCESIKIPKEILEAYNYLIKKGYTKWLVQK